MAKARLEEQELQALLQEQDAQAAAEARMRQQQVVQGLGVGGMALSQYATAAGEAKAREQEMQALMQIIGGPDTGSTAGGVTSEVTPDVSPEVVTFPHHLLLVYHRCFDITTMLRVIHHLLCRLYLVHL